MDLIFTEPPPPTRQNPRVPPHAPPGEGAPGRRPPLRLDHRGAPIFDDLRTLALLQTQSARLF